jgi:hypothetical protein
MTVTKLFYAILICLPIFLYSCESNDNIVYQTTKDTTVVNKTLVELFTNTSCIPCVSANTFLDGIKHCTGITNNDTNVIIIRYHSTIFPNDPFYLFNPAPNFARQQYYNALTNPRGYMMGTYMGAFDAATWINSINQKLASTNLMDISFTINYDTASRNGSLAIQVKQSGGTTQTDLVIHIAVTESELYYNASNGETEFDNTLRDLITGTNGESITVTSGQTTNLNHNFSIMNGIDIPNTEIIIFVQNTSTKEIFGVNKHKLM